MGYFSGMLSVVHHCDNETSQSRSVQTVLDAPLPSDATNSKGPPNNRSSISTNSNETSIYLPSLLKELNYDLENSNHYEVMKPNWWKPYVDRFAKVWPPHPQKDWCILENGPLSPLMLPKNTSAQGMIYIKTVSLLISSLVGAYILILWTEIVELTASFSSFYLHSTKHPVRHRRGSR